MKACLFLTLAGAISFCALTASAEDAASVTQATPSESESAASASERARQLGLAGLSSYGQGHYEEALTLFRQAEAHAHSPVFLLYEARCLLALDRIPEGRTLLEELSRAPAQPSAPRAWRRTRERAAFELHQLDTRSTHSATASHGKQASLAPRTRHAVADAPSPARAAQQAKVPAEAAADLRPAAFVAYGAGAAGLLFAAFTGALALLEASELKQVCGDQACPHSQLANYDQALRLANLSTAGLVTGAVGATLGTVLLLASPSRATRKRARSSYALRVGAHGASLRLTF